MLKLIGLAVVVLLAAVLALAASRPDTFVVQRSAVIKAPPHKVFALINDFHQWQQWSPWERMDPGMRRTYSGAPSGVGSLYAWEGNKKVGRGQMEITEATDPSKVGIKLDFLSPFEAHNTAQFVLTPQGDATTVTWSMAGPSPFIAKVIGLVANMDTLVGKDFEAGLANLKAVAEK